MPEGQRGLLDDQTPIRIERPIIAIGHFPQITIGIGEVAAVAAPKDILCGLLDLAATLFGQFQDAVYVFFFAGIMR